MMKPEMRTLFVVQNDDDLHDDDLQVVIILEFCGFWDKLIRKSYEFVPKSAILE